MAHRSQGESEQPAKVYQLDAVESKVDVALEKLDALLTQTSGLVTTGQLSAAEKILRESINEEVEKIHLEYRPMKRNVTWFTRVIIGEGIAIIAQVILILIIANKG